MKNAINWFEMPALDLDRAVRFWERILDGKLRRETFHDAPFAVFPADADGVKGSLVARFVAGVPQRRPSGDGTLIYLNTDGRMVDVLARVDAAGGAIVHPRTSIGPMGWIATVRDTEGNVVGLHEAA